jgi:HEAT repeat protein
MRRRQPELVSRLRKCEGGRRQIGPALRAVMLDPGAGWYTRGSCARLLALDEASDAMTALLDLFFAQTERTELWDTALTIESGGDASCVPRLVAALHDSNPDRRHAAARALGWLWPVGRRAAKALVRALLDPSQPLAVREEAAESLAYSDYKGAIEPLISVLSENEVRIRFWVVFALGGIGSWQRYTIDGSVDPRVIRELEGMLGDEEVPPGGWWSVGREALAMLGKLQPEYAARLEEETEKALEDTRSSPEDVRWAKSYGNRLAQRD